MQTGNKGITEVLITDWLNKHVVFADTKTHGRCNKILIRHLNVERKFQGDVASFSVKFEEGATEELPPLVNNIVEAMQRDANDLNAGIQSYCIQAFFPNDQSYSPRKIVRVTSVDEDIERDILPSEPPTEKGLTSQLMRHLESIMRTTVVSQSHMTDSLRKENERLAQMVEKFSQQQVDFMVLLQDTADHSNQRRLAEKKAEADLAFKDGIFAQLKSVVPIIANRLAGKQILPENDRSFMLMAALLENLSDEQQAMLRNTLTAPQAAVLSEILTEYEKKKDSFLDGNRKKEVELSHKNELPPPVEPGKRQLNASNEEKGPRPIPMFQSIAERMASDSTSNVSSDPKIRKIEDDVQHFTSRFADMLGSQKPTKGE
jgi:hypothetical protein